MTAINLDRLPENASGLKLYKIVMRNGEEVLLANELVIFSGGQSAINTTLRRAALAGRVEVDPEGDLPDFYADIYEGPNGDDGWNHSVALDADSYRSLKHHWMRCNLEPESTDVGGSATDQPTAETPLEDRAYRHRRSGKGRVF